MADTNMSSDVMSKVRKLKGFLKTNVYPPYSTYERHNSIDRDDYNCYSYIWGLTDEQYRDIGLGIQDLWNLGFSQSYFVLHDRVPSPTVMHDLLVNDMNTLGIDVAISTESEKLGADEWKIALYYNDIEDDFHFAVQDRHGTWAAKMGYGGFVEIMEDGPLRVYESASNNTVYRLVNVYKLNISKLKAEEKKPNFAQRITENLRGGITANAEKNALQNKTPKFVTRLLGE